MTDEPRFPDVTVRLSGEDGNTGAIMGRVTTALRRAGHGAAIQNEFRTAAFNCGSYDEVLRLVMAWVETE